MTDRPTGLTADLLRRANELGFECQGLAPAARLEVNPEVRSMCAADRCQSYGKNWMCPPACGDLDEFAAGLARRADCVIVQTVAELEDEFDVEGMMEAEALHKRRFAALARFARETAQSQGLPAPLPLAAGTCTLCPTCTCPDEPCRNPEDALVSMEAAGLLVSDACKAAQIPYYHGKGTMAYTSCVLA